MIVRRSAFALIALATVTFGCSSGTRPLSQASCPAVLQPRLSFGPVYPVPNATDVPDDASTFVYYYPSFGSNASPVPLEIGLADANPQSSVAMSPTSVPSPLPTPTSQPTADAILLAAAFPKLSPASTYNVYAVLEYAHNCYETPVIDSFTTK